MFIVLLSLRLIFFNFKTKVVISIQNTYFQIRQTK